MSTTGGEIRQRSAAVTFAKGPEPGLSSYPTVAAKSQQAKESR